MINIENPNMILLNPILSRLLTDFKRKQVSRFPIIAQVRNEFSIIFKDSRISYPKSDIKRIIGELNIDGLDDKNRQFIQLNSRLINNEKYAENNPDYYSRKTIDEKKVSKWMRDYLKPFSTDELIEKSAHHAESHVNTWVNQPKHLVNDLVNNSKSDIMKELYAMKQAGLQPLTDTFKKYMGEAMNAYEDWLVRNTKNFSRTHVFINPDESVMVTIKSKEGVQETTTCKNETTTYESLLDCPVILQQNITMLRMLDGVDFIAQVGYKASNIEFWIETHTDSE
jgi:hypothetical protein